MYNVIISNRQRQVIITALGSNSLSLRLSKLPVNTPASNFEFKLEEKERLTIVESLTSWCQKNSVEAEIEQDIFSGSPTALLQMLIELPRHDVPDLTHGLCL